MRGKEDDAGPGDPGHRLSPAGEGTVSPGGGRRASLWRPGWREAAVFALLVVFGFAVWFAVTSGITSRLFGVNLCLWNPGVLFISLVQIVCGAAALISGFVFSRGFYLWGVALALHSPFTQGLTVYMMEQRGLGLTGGTQGLVAYAIITAWLIFFTMGCYTVLSAIGMGLGYLVRRW